MDVVRDNIEEIGGTISLTTTAGKGTRFSMKIPLTLAITPALIVQVGAHRFALPQHSVVEVVGIGDDSPHQIERIRESLVLQLRNEVLPLADLKVMLDIDDGRIERERRIVIMRVGAHTFGNRRRRRCRRAGSGGQAAWRFASPSQCLSGHTILGDGSVVLILDPSGSRPASGSSNRRIIPSSPSTNPRRHRKASG